MSRDVDQWYSVRFTLIFGYCILYFAYKYLTNYAVSYNMPILQYCVGKCIISKCSVCRIWNFLINMLASAGYKYFFFLILTFQKPLRVILRRILHRLLSVRIFFFFFHFCIIEETQDAKMPKNACFEQKRTFVFSVSSILYKGGKK